MKLEIYAPCINCIFREFNVVNTSRYETDCFGESKRIDVDLEMCVHAPMCKFIEGEPMLTGTKEANDD